MKIIEGQTIIIDEIIEGQTMKFDFFWHPSSVQNAKVFNGSLLPIPKKRTFTVLSWNIQFLAGKNYFFFYDDPDFNGPDCRPSEKDIDETSNEVARVIREISPDFVLLQEVDDGAVRTNYEDQGRRLLQLLPINYNNYAEAFYWKAKFVPHPKIWGSVGMKLLILSKWNLKNAVRYQLPSTDESKIRNLFSLKRAVLECHVPLSDNSELVIFNTHLEAFVRGSNVMQKQVVYIDRLLIEQERKKRLWIMGGDFNLLPNSAAFINLPKKQQSYYNPKTEMELLLSKYSSIPKLEEIESSEQAAWFTHFPNSPDVSKPDRTIDYILYAKKLSLENHFVLHKNTYHISDHLPLVMEISLPYM